MSPQPLNHYFRVPSHPLFPCLCCNPSRCLRFTLPTGPSQKHCLEKEAGNFDSDPHTFTNNLCQTSKLFWRFFLTQMIVLKRVGPAFSPCICRWKAIILLWCGISYLRRAFAAPTSANYSPYHYDHTTPLFTPDGRLLQVEYAAKSVDNYAGPLLAIPVQQTRNDTNDTATTEIEAVWAIVAFTPRASVLQRLVVLPAPPLSSSSSQSCPILVGLSGVLPDGLALLQKVQDVYHRQQQQFGGAHAMSAARLVQTAASACHEHVLGGGLRPYGARLTLIQQGVVYTTDPSGAVRVVELQNKNKQSPLVLAGPKSLAHVKVQPTLRETVQACVQQLRQQNPNMEYRVQVVLCAGTGDMYPLSMAQADRLLVDDGDSMTR